MTDIEALMGTQSASGWFFGPDLRWQLRAECGTSENRDLADKFFPGGGAPSFKGKELCKRCPVREECLDWALSHEEAGIWGGLTEGERLKLLASTLPLSFNQMQETGR